MNHYPENSKPFCQKERGTSPEKEVNKKKVIKSLVSGRTSVMRLLTSFRVFPRRIYEGFFVIMGVDDRRWGTCYSRNEGLQ